MGVLHAFPAAETLAPTQARIEYSSRAIPLILSSLSSADRSARVLDLGPAFGANLTFYSRIARKIHFEDLYQTLYSETGDVRAQRKLMSELLPFHADMRFDLIQCWDLFNYLCPEEINALAQHLVRFSRVGTILTAFIQTKKMVSSQPLHFRVCSDSTISYELQGIEEAQGPRYSKVELQKFLGGFKRIRTLLLRNGFEEQIYIR